MSQIYKSGSSSIITPITPTQGGTGVSNPTAHTLPVAEGSAPFNFLGPLTNGQLLIGSTGADPVPAAITAGSGITVTNGAGTITVGSTSFIPINTITTGGTTAVQFTGITNAFNTYILSMSNVVSATDNVTLELQVSINNGSSYINTGYISGVNRIPYNSATITNGNSTTFITLATGLSSAGTPQGNFFVNLANVTNGGQLSITGTGAYLVSGGVLNMVNIGGTYNVSAVINAFQIIASTGNIAGTFTLYGYK